MRPFAKADKKDVGNTLLRAAPADWIIDGDRKTKKHKSEHVEMVSCWSVEKHATRPMPKCFKAFPLDG